MVTDSINCDNTPELILVREKEKIQMMSWKMASIDFCVSSLKCSESVYETQFSTFRALSTQQKDKTEKEKRDMQRRANLIPEHLVT